MKRCFVWAPLAAFLVAGSVGAQDETKAVHGLFKPLPVTVTAGKHDYQNTPVVVPLNLPDPLLRAGVVLKNKDTGTTLIGQLTAPGLLTEGVKRQDPRLKRCDLHFIVPSLKAGQTLTFLVDISTALNNKTRDTFHWVDVPRQYAELRFGDRPVLKYMDRPYDKSTQQRDQTYKVFHHLYDPEGKQLVTNGGQTDYPNEPKRKLLYSHHRGLMFAFMRNTYNGKVVADTWHAKPGDTHQEHTGFANVEAGPVLGRHRALVEWHGPDNAVFAKEEREVTVYNVPGGTLVEFASRLAPKDGPVKLGGDPQHAGFQFRARNDVADKTAKQTYYLRPDGKGQPGATRNWPGDKTHVNLPWDAMCFVLDGKRYTVAYLDRPSNPREARWSERDYGRFGNYFEYEMSEQHSLVVDYRIWLQDGEMTGPQVQALSTAFVTPPAVTVK
jgi:hypothetical protein